MDTLDDSDVRRFNKMPINPRYRIFLSINFDEKADFVRKNVERIAVKHNIEVISAPPGDTAMNPAEQVRNLLGSVEGLLVILDTDTAWLSNEIGIAYAYSIPICVLAKQESKAQGVARLVTSIKEVNISNEGQLQSAVDQALDVLKGRIQEIRKGWPEPPTNGTPVEIYNFQRLIKLVEAAFKGTIGQDINGHNAFKPTLLLGISRGGIIIADILSRRALDLPLALIEADRTSRSEEIIYQDEPIKTVIKKHLRAIIKPKEARLLIVDDVMKSGKSLQGAMHKVSEVVAQLPKDDRARVKIKSLVLIAHKLEREYNPDYVVETIDGDRDIILPYGRG